MPATQRQLRKKKEVFYGKLPPPWLPSKSPITSGARKRKPTASESSVKNSVEVVTLSEDEASSDATYNPSADDNSSTSIQISQNVPPSPKAGSSTDRVPLKRARSATVTGDDEIPTGDASPTPVAKRRRTGESSQKHKSTAVSPTRTTGKARADLSPAAEAAIHQMRAEIKEGIKTLKRIRKYVDGLLEFKAILDSQAAENVPSAWED